MGAATQTTFEDFVEEHGSGSGARRVARLSPGALIAGKYRIRGTLGIGGWAVVYDAEHIELEHGIAIKVMHVEDGAPETALERFRREARLSAHVRHRNVLEVHDVGILDDGSPYLVMERLEGEDLDRHIERGKLPIAAVVELGKQLLGALSAVADSGIVHRDIKPHNIMLHREGGGDVIVKLVDFGISKARTSPVPSKSLTQDGMVIGTPHYMAPEQVRGENVDQRTDLYAAAVVMYEALTGDAPFDAPAAGALLAAILRDEPTPPRKLRSNCPPKLERIILKGLAKEPKDRYQHPLEMAEELEALGEELELPRGSGAWTAPDVDRASPTEAFALLRSHAEDVFHGMSTRPSWRRRATILGVAGIVVGILSWGAATHWANSPEGGAVVHDEAASVEISGAGAAPIARAPAQDPSAGSTASADPAEAGEASTGEPAEASTDDPPDRAPARARALTRRALGAYVRGQLPKARLMYRRALRADASHAEAWRGLALVSARMGNASEARNAFRKYLRLRPGASDADEIRTRLERL